MGPRESETLHHPLQSSESDGHPGPASSHLDVQGSHHPSLTAQLVFLLPQGWDCLPARTPGKAELASPRRGAVLPSVTSLPAPSRDTPIRGTEAQQEAVWTQAGKRHPRVLSSLPGLLETPRVSSPNSVYLMDSASPPHLLTPLTQGPGPHTISPQVVTAPHVCAMMTLPCTHSPQSPSRTRSPTSPLYNLAKSACQGSRPGHQASSLTALPQLQPTRQPPPASHPARHWLW